MKKWRVLATSVHVVLLAQRLVLRRVTRRVDVVLGVVQVVPVTARQRVKCRLQRSQGRRADGSGGQSLLHARVPGIVGVVQARQESLAIVPLAQVIAAGGVDAQRG